MKTEEKGKRIKCSCIWLCVLCLASWKASAAEKLLEWDSQQAAEQNCVSASKYGLSEKCGVCGGAGWLKKSRYAYVAPIRGKLVPGRRGRKQDYYAQCKWCLEKKSRWEKQKEELQQKEFERKRRKREELEKAKKSVKDAEVELEFALSALSAALPEKHCDVHKWKAEYAPRFGGDYYTADAEAKYAQNYMKALELQDKGLLKCMCHDSKRIAYWKECEAKAENAKKKLEHMAEK